MEMRGCASDPLSVNAIEAALDTFHGEFVYVVRIRTGNFSR
jgi:hypothetical protein